MLNNKKTAENITLIVETAKGKRFTDLLACLCYCFESMLLLYTVVLKAYSKFKLGKIASAAFDYELKSI